MKNITKLISVLAALAIALICCGCGAKSMTAKEGKLIMATNAEFPPYEYKEGDKIVGIDAEVAQLIADKLGLELEIADVDFDSIIPGVHPRYPVRQGRHGYGRYDRYRREKGKG